MQQRAQAGIKPRTGPVIHGTCSARWATRYILILGVNRGLRDISKFVFGIESHTHTHTLLIMIRYFHLECLKSFASTTVVKFSAVLLVRHCHRHSAATPREQCTSNIWHRQYFYNVGILLILTHWKCTIVINHYFSIYTVETVHYKDALHKRLLAISHT